MLLLVQLHRVSERSELLAFGLHTDETAADEAIESLKYIYEQAWVECIGDEPHPFYGGIHRLFVGPLFVLSSERVFPGQTYLRDGGVF